MLETNGDATLSSSAGDNVEVEARRVTRFEVYNADQPLAGQPKPNTQFYYLTDGEGGVLDLTTMQGGITPNADGGFDSEADMDTWVAAAPLDDPGYEDVSDATPLPDNGGNLQVGGDANVDGKTTLNGLTNTGDTELNGDIDLNGDVAVDGVLTVDTIEDANGDGLIRRDATTGAVHIGDGSLIVDDTVTNHVVTSNSGTKLVLGGDIASTNNVDESKNIEVANDLVVMGDTDLKGDLDVQGTTRTNGIINTGHIATSSLTTTNDIIAGRDLTVARDARINGVLSLADTGHGGVADVAYAINDNADSIRNNRISIQDNKDNIRTNKRGIAMVAAMTNTTVLPGNTSAVDFNLSHFDGSTGFGFGYAHAVNSCLQLKIALASTTDFEESVVRAGVSYQW